MSIWGVMNNETLRRVKFYIKLLARDLGVPDSHSDYDKFLILGQSRSGSNFLRSLLESHTQIFTYGELFRASNSIIWGRSDYNRYLQSPELMSLLKNNPIFFWRIRFSESIPKKYQRWALKCSINMPRAVQCRVFGITLKIRKTLRSFT